jgi:hypothetical protein
MRGALHEIAAAGEIHLPAAAGFALGLAVCTPSPRLFWITEDMGLAESGAPHGAGIDAFGFAPERLVMVSTAHRRDMLWAMEEAVRCRAVGTVIGEMRAGDIGTGGGATAFTRGSGERHAGTPVARHATNRCIHLPPPVGLSELPLPFPNASRASGKSDHA